MITCYFRQAVKMLKFEPCWCEILEHLHVPYVMCVSVCDIVFVCIGQGIHELCALGLEIIC